MSAAPIWWIFLVTQADSLNWRIASQMISRAPFKESGERIPAQAEIMTREKNRQNTAAIAFCAPDKVFAVEFSARAAIGNY